MVEALVEKALVLVDGAAAKIEELERVVKLSGFALPPEVIEMGAIVALVAILLPPKEAFSAVQPMVPDAKNPNPAVIASC